LMTTTTEQQLEQDAELVLFESAAFLSLFRVLIQPSTASDVNDHARFASAVKLVAFYQFASIQEASECCHELSNGSLPSSLRRFLDNNTISESSVLGVMESKLAANISQEMSIKCVVLPFESHLTRGLMMHGTQLVSSLIDTNIVDKSRIALGHAFSRRQISVKDLSTKDNMIIQSSAALEFVEKNANSFYMRIKEWYGYHFPELSKLVEDPVAYIACVKAIGSKSNLQNQEVCDQLTKILGPNHEDKVDTIVSAAKHSVGMELSELDFEMINNLATQVTKMQLYRVDLKDYVSKSLQARVPNTQHLLGDHVAAHFLSKTGGLSNLSKLPSSTLQILGAEKALFKAIKSRGKTPKYGFIFNTPYITKSSSKNKGKVARLLANKASLCIRLDQFHECSEPVFGEKLKEYLEKRVTELESGVKHSVAEQVEISHRYLQEAADKAEEILAASKPKKTVEKKLNEPSATLKDSSPAAVAEEAPSSKAKKSKKSKEEKLAKKEAKRLKKEAKRAKKAKDTAIEA